MTSDPNTLELPTGTVDLRSELVPAVRELLRHGLDPSFLASNVRLGAFEPFGGGLKSDLVGGLRIDINAALKLGDRELELHRWLMDRVNRAGKRTFPSVLALVPLDKDRQLLFMEQLLRHQTLLTLTYQKSTSRKDLERIVDRVLDHVRTLRRTYRSDEKAMVRFPRTVDPYSQRLRTRLKKICAEDPGLHRLWDTEGVIFGHPVPPLKTLLRAMSQWLRTALNKVPPTLCHGDLHLSNIMARRRGQGYSVRLIDPNPTVGISDPLYDAGKLMHWAEPVGWAQVSPKCCRAFLRTSRGKWTLSASLEGTPSAAEQRRSWLESLLRDAILANGGRGARTPGSPTTEERTARLEISIAAAHVGLAALLGQPDEKHARRFVVAHCIAALARWQALTQH